MRQLLLALLSAAHVLGSAADALACRTVVPREHELAQRSIVLASVLHAERVEQPGWITWRILAEPLLNEDGRDTPMFEFTVTLGSDRCGLSVPTAGELWVLYSDQADPRSVQDAYPLEYVRGYDLRLADVR